jgi:hypothetical protein
VGPIHSQITNFPSHQPADPVVLAIGVPPRGVLRTFRVLSIGAPPASVVYSLYSSKQAFVLDTNGNPTPTLAANSELYRVLLPVTVTSLAIIAGGFDLAVYYQNMDGGPGALTALSRLYLLIAGAGTVNPLAVITTVETPIL